MLARLDNSGIPSGVLGYSGRYLAIWRLLAPLGVWQRSEDRSGQVSRFSRE